MNIAETDADFLPGKYKVFVRYKDGLSRQFDIEAVTSEGFKIFLNQFCPRVDNIVYARSRLECQPRKSQ